MKLLKLPVKIILAPIVLAIDGHCIRTGTDDGCIYPSAGDCVLPAGDVCAVGVHNGRCQERRHGSVAGFSRKSLRAAQGCRMAVVWPRQPARQAVAIRILLRPFVIRCGVNVAPFFL